MKLMWSFQKTGIFWKFTLRSERIETSEYNSVKLYSNSVSDKRQKKDEEKEHGIFFEDNYDYLQHIKPRTNLSLEPLPENVTVIEAKKPTDHLEVKK